VRAVTWPSRASLVGHVAVTDLPADVALVPSLVTDQPVLAAGEALVGLELGPNAWPAGNLEVGDAVAVVVAVPAGASTPDATSAPASTPATPPAVGAPVTNTATVWAISEVADHEGTTLLTLRMAQADAQRVSALAEQVRVVRVVR
jgi:hypothetical protein